MRVVALGMREVESSRFRGLFCGAFRSGGLEGAGGLVDGNRCQISV